MDGKHQGSVLGMQEEEYWGPQEVLREVAQQWGSPEMGGGVSLAMAPALATHFSSGS